MAGGIRLKRKKKVVAAVQNIASNVAPSIDSSASDIFSVFSGIPPFSDTSDSNADLGREEEASVERRLATAEKTILLKDPASPEFLAAVDELIALDDYARSSAGALLQAAMSRLEDEFRDLLNRNVLPLDVSLLQGTSLDELSLCPSSVSFAIIRPGAVLELKQIASRMISSGYTKELSHIYSSTRRVILDGYISILGVDRLSIDEVQRMEWRPLDEKIKKWTNAIRFTASALLLLESRLCFQIFAGGGQAMEECFLETTKGCINRLLNFGNAVAISCRSPEKLFSILEMYDALHYIIPDLSLLFHGASSQQILDEAEYVLQMLGKAATANLSEFATILQYVSPKRPIQGEVHPMTSYVMNYVESLVKFRGLLDSLLGEDNRDDAETVDGTTPFVRHLLLLLSHLESTIIERSKLYEDEPLRYIFLMNNILYIAKKVKGSELGTLLGDQWVCGREVKVSQLATRYLRSSWINALSFLKDDGFGMRGTSYHTSRAALKEKFKNFNLAFEDIYKTQSTWKVPDSQLRDELRISISEKVLPAYRAFWGRFGSQLEGERHVTKYVRYTPDDLENHLTQLFEGSVPQPGHTLRNTAF
ncbi:hypothetical protein HPP92_025253 [Vanilla planifolia]|uniref:Exocyst subunit Exo70 family protein n=1 Tax=Vanilla planifolia TaxID=51239 RepID=A0A835U7K6_VANPL|nr:hypothetical protein HPP92_025253 [Vanilla planifolia]